MSITTNRKLQATVGQLVAERPGRARVFEALGIDYCCGGKKPLGSAAREKGLDEKTVLGVLDAFDEQAAPAEREWTAASVTELADHIEQTHHAYLKTELPRLEAMINKVADRHGSHSPSLLELAAVFDAFKAELESHMRKEELVLFPLCRHLDRGGASDRSVNAPIAVMVQEHDDAGEALRRMRALTNDYTPPPGACNTYRAMLDALHQLEQDMHRHVHKENSILFPKAMELDQKRSA